jgi:alpha-mannosidase
MAAEKFSLVASWAANQPYPQDMARAWKNILFNQFHDVMAGTSIEPAYFDAQATHGESIAIGQRALNLAIQALAWGIRVSPDECRWPIVVFNPNAWDVKTNIQKDIVFYGLPEDAILLDSQGQRLPFQIVQGSALVTFGPCISFTAKLPALGYSTFMLVSRSAQPAYPDMTATQTTLENRYWKLEVDPATGSIRSLIDKSSGAEIINGQAARAVVIDDPSDTWSHGILHFDKVIGAFKGGKLTLTEVGPVKATLTARSSYGASHLTQAYTLYADLDRIDVAVTVDWHESQKMLKLRFPINIDQGVATYETSYGTIERPMDGEEEPGQVWVDVSGHLKGTNQPYGVSLLNDGKYSFDILPADIGLTVLRSPIFAHHQPAEPDPARTYTCVDQGVQHFNYALIPHQGDWKHAGTVRRGAELNQAPIVLIGTAHADGALPREDSYIQVDQPNILVSVLKKSEDGDDLILRAYETNHQATKVNITLPKWGRILPLSFGPCEIKTLLIPRDSSAPVVETDLLERPI